MTMRHGAFLTCLRLFLHFRAKSAKIWARSAGTCETRKTFCSWCISRRCRCCCWWRWLWLWSWLLLVAVVVVAFCPILVVRVPLRNCVAFGIDGKQPPISTLGWKMGASFCRQTWKLHKIAIFRWHRFPTSTMDHEEIEHAAEPNFQFLRQKSKILSVDLGFGVLHVFWIYKII